MFTVKKIINNLAGQGLIEIIIAVAIFALLAASMISLALGGNMAILQGGEQLRAQSLANEALEAVRSVGARAWNELKYNQSAVATSSNQWILSGEGTDESLGNYQRQIVFSDVCRDALHNISNCPATYIDKSTKKVSVTISWQVRPGVNGSIVREAYVTNWDSQDWTQTDWSGGSGQSIWSLSNKYESDDGNLDYSYPGEIRLASISSGNCGTETWNFNTATRYIYDSDIEIAGGYAQLVFKNGNFPYSDSKPTIHPSSSYTVNYISTWTSFSENAIKEGSSEIYYQLSNDNGTTWYYWDGVAWGVADDISFNIATEINAHINTFATSSAQIMFKAFLSSNGTDQVRLDSVSIGCAQEYNWPFESDSLYTFNNQKIELSGGVAKLSGSSGAGGSLDPGFSYGNSSGYNWPFDVPSDYIYDINKITVTGSNASLIGLQSDVFRVTEYYLGTGNFSGTSYNLTLNQNLSPNYFVILQGSDGSGTSATDNYAREDYASLVSDPWGTGDLAISGSDNVIGLSRSGSYYSWVGVVTVVECLNNCSNQGFVLHGVERVTHSGTATSGTDTSAVSWNNLNQTMLMGGFNGSGCDTTGASAAYHKSCQARIWPSGTNTINWQRNATGGSLTNAVSTVMAIEWGSEWTIQRVNVTGLAGGNGANSTSEYNTGTISSVARENTWVWGNGWTAAGGVGNSSEGVLVTLGNGVAKNTNENRVAVGAEYVVSRSFEVYTLTHPSLSVDYQFKTDGNSKALTYDQAIALAAGNRMALVYNGCNGTTTTYPQSMFSARYYTNSSVRLERRRSGQNFPAWIQGINFSNIKTPLTYSSDNPSIYPVNSYPVSSVQNWSGFTETATKNAGEIYYQLSSDNGTTWQYWDGSVWSPVSLATHYNTASVVNANIDKFSTSTDQIKFKAFLSSDGSQNVQLDNVNIAYSQAASPWSFYTWDVGGGEATPTGQLAVSGGNPGQYAQVDIAASNNDEIGAYWQQAVPINTNNPQVEISFDYKVLLFSAPVNSAQVRVYLDTSAGTPTNQVASFNLNSTTNWTSSGVIDASSIVTTSGTYYLKIAFWLDSTNNNGSYSVGFDNVNLNWFGTGYPSDSPSIQPNDAYSISNLDHYTGFYETATKNTNTEIYYQLSSDNGATWQFWNGLVWGTAGQSDYNTAEVINNNIINFATTTGTIIFKAFLQSDGQNQVELDNVRISWNEPGSSGEQSQTFGQFVSSAYDLGDNSPLQILEWQESVPANTSLKIQVRTAADNSGSPGVWTDWYGESGPNTYYTNAKQYLLSTDLNGRRWAQYRAEFSGDGSDTPVLYNVKINYR